MNISNKFQIAKNQPSVVAELLLIFSNFSLVLLIKVLLIKEACKFGTAIVDKC